MIPTTSPYRGPVGLALTGVIFLVIAAVIDAMLPVLGAVAGILSFVGWACIVVAAVWALIILIRGLA